MSSIANDITAEKKKLSAMLSEKYTVDYFQREYKWERRHIEQLLVDLEAAFLVIMNTHIQLPILKIIIVII